MASYTTNFLWNHPKPGDGLYNYSDGMINTPDTPETLNFTKNQLPVIDTSNPQVKQAGMFPPNFWTGVGSLWGIGDMAANKYKNWMGNYDLANRNNLNLENYITLDGTTPVINEGQLLADTNWVPQNITEETETIYPADNDIDATYTAEDAFYTPQQNKFSFPSILGLAKKVIEPNTREENFGLASFTRNPTTGRVAGNPTYDVFAGGNVASAFGKGMGNRAQKRIDTIENTLRSKYNLSDEEIEDVYAGTYKGPVRSQLIQRLPNFNNQLSNYNKVLGTWQGSGIDTRTGGGNRGYVGAQFGNRNYADPGVDAEENQPYNNQGNQGYGGAQFDGATTRGEYDRNPSGFSGSFNKGGRVGLYAGGPPEMEEDTMTTMEFMQDQGIPFGEMASNPDPMAELNEFSLQIFKKTFDQLNDSERDMLFEMLNDQAENPRPVIDPYGTPQGEEIVEEGIASLV